MSIIRRIRSFFTPRNAALGSAGLAGLGLFGDAVTRGIALCRIEVAAAPVAIEALPGGVLCEIDTARAEVLRGELRAADPGTCLLYATECYGVREVVGFSHERAGAVAGWWSPGWSGRRFLDVARDAAEQGANAAEEG
jgi:hypothetical protein